MAYFTAYYPLVSFAANKNMGAALNESGVLYVRRIGLTNAQATGVSGALCQLEVRVYQDTETPKLTGMTQVLPIAHDTRSSAAKLGSAIFGHAGTVTGTSSTIRRVFWSSDEPSNAAGTLDELETIVPLYVILDAGYGNDEVQPITLRPGQMVAVWNTTGAAGLLDTWIEVERA